MRLGRTLRLAATLVIATPSIARSAGGKNCFVWVKDHWERPRAGVTYAPDELKCDGDVEVRDHRPPDVLPLRGWVDMHTHPMVHLGFGGKLVHGAPDVGSLIPTDNRCRHRVRATSLEHALGDDNSTHGGWGALDNTCGDTIRNKVIHTLQKELKAFETPDRAHGAKDFRDWPRWNDVTHQKMWVDWIRRAHLGGQRVMVALATQNQTLAAAVAGPNDGPTDDRASADLQIDELKKFVARHSDFMEVALTPADLRRIVNANKLAIVLGLEMDNIGGFDRKPAVAADMVRAELNRLRGRGVRYIFPIHVIDNAFGGTALYVDIFNVSNYHVTGSFWDVECAAPADRIDYRFDASRPDPALAAVKATKLGIDPLRKPPTPPHCAGHVNRKGLTPLGEVALREMMRLGMLIDIDHMSQKAANGALTLAEAVPGGYPLNSGHNRLRGDKYDEDLRMNENTRTEEQFRRIARLGGMVGVGCEAMDAHAFARSYATIAELMGTGAVAIGSDLNGLVRAPKPRSGSHVVYDARFPRSRTGTKEWDYNRDGVAHYGMLADFVRDMRTAPDGERLVSEKLLGSAEFFAQMWERAEAQKGNVP